jgi:hypothetical protein
MTDKIELTLEEKIDRSREGRSQMWIVSKLREMGCGMSEAQFTRKKKDIYTTDSFTETELSALSTILNTDFTIQK